MKLFSKKTISILVILATTMLFVLSIYYAFSKYKTYQNLEKTLQQRELFNNANNLLKILEKERLRSTLYLSNPNQKNLNKLNQERRKVNIHIKNTQKLKLTKVINQLLTARKKIDSLSMNYQELIYNIFHKNIINNIILQMNNLSLLKNLQSEIQLIKLRESINMENSFLAPILNKKNIMKEKDIIFWEKILNLRQVPTFHSIKDETLLLTIKDEYNINNFSKLSEEARVELFISARNAHYPISFKEWFKKTSKEKSKINHIQKLLSNLHTNNLKNQFLNHQGKMYKSIIISLLILILLGLILAILRILQKMSKEKRILKNTVKEIEVDLDENKKREIKEILTHNSSIEVYEFLVNEIKEPSRAKDLFLANMSHEIRTPLNGIIGFTKELKETKLSEEQNEIVSIIEESSDNLMHIVNDILDFSKIKAGKIQLEHILFNPIEKFEASIDTFVAKAREKEIELKVCIDPNIPTNILGDPTKMVQILSNLISNAIKFTPTQGNIEIDIKQIKDKDLKQDTNIKKDPTKMLQILSNFISSAIKFTHKQGNTKTDISHIEDKNLKQDTNIKLYFSVKDSGIGVGEKEKKEIFNAFSQADASTSRKYGGTGLGLSIASQFIKHMGGELNIESQIGDGARFFFSIELEKPHGLQERPRENLSAYKIGYIPPIGNTSIDKSLKAYVEYQNATFKTYTQQALLKSIEPDLPDLLFIDYKCFDNEEDIEYFLDLPLKIVLIVADNREKELKNIRGKIDKILHKPVNFTRTIKSLEVLTRTTKESSKKSKDPTKKFKDMHALVAEDNFINQKLMKSVLNRFGMKVTLVSNGKEALEYRVNDEYDIIFMDIQMPIMGGIESTQNILSFEKKSNTKHIPIVALTANALEGDREKYMAIGMDAYLAKPMNLDELKKVLNSFVNE